ncbi:bifunctional molybdenum cofactor biosynthesis protein MoaC/MoaB [uncultured Mailhella sp.]|uniref:bifunctional molybdenum cofactor biosynthesis protein MoaC/MoaB n=1 Tax=uncultured Mailhella sp. TaxID=1981031 RepID=UPI0026289459|nr:bifunctional molybdenum cofactor biosynthesis protein MoaC/MoaB [uncultured Mailhella sp.]
MNFSHLDEEGGVRMVDVGGKAATQRTAIARAIVELSESTMTLLKARALPKGDVFAVAQAAGIMAAKRTWELIPLCHPLALTHVDVRLKAEGCRIVVEALTRTTGRTGVEMESIVAAQTAAAVIYDMTKAVQRDVVIRDVRLILKSGGKSGLFQTDTPLLFDMPEAALPCPRPEPQAWTGEGLAAACITLSDKGYAGERSDESGPALLALLEALHPAKTQSFLLPDEPRALARLVRELAASGWRLILTTGGTGLSPRDRTPEALLPLLERRLPGFEQVMFAGGLNHTPHAVLSRCLAGTVGQALVIALPGSRRGAVENLSALLPVLPHALEKLAGDMRDCGR